MSEKIAVKYWEDTGEYAIRYRKNEALALDVSEAQKVFDDLTGLGFVANFDDRDRRLENQAGWIKKLREENRALKAKESRPPQKELRGLVDGLGGSEKWISAFSGMVERIEALEAFLETATEGADAKEKEQIKKGEPKEDRDLLPEAVGAYGSGHTPRNRLTVHKNPEDGGERGIPCKDADS